MEEREQRMLRVRELFTRAGFYVSDAHGLRPNSFDLLARRDSTLVVVKVLRNIDALGPEDADRLREVARLFHAAALLVGEASGNSALEAGVVYTRYAVPIVVEETLEEFLLRGVPPFLVSSPGGVFARIDGERLQILRGERRLSLGALAVAAGVSRRTIQLYEDGGGAEITIVRRLEEFLDEPIVLPVDLLPAAPAPGSAPDGRTAAQRSSPAPRRRTPSRSGDALRDDVSDRLGTMGWQVEVTLRCPFDLFTHGTTQGEEEILLAAVGSLRSAQHRAEILQGIARAIEGYSMFVTAQPTGRESVDGVPLVTAPELQRRRDRAELLELLQERAGA